MVETMPLTIGIVALCSETMKNLGKITKKDFKGLSKENR